ncbi:MAG: hypothetical protein AAF617_09565 [Bacteroidota bacterium]
MNSYVVDHIYIFSTQKGNEAENLIRFGCTEGSSRIHLGQGTENRKFYFENFFLEILWVRDATEIQSKVTAPTKLWERSQFSENNHSPFGLCFVNSASTDDLFADAQTYQPAYFPNEMSIDIIPNEAQPQLPWIFRLPYRGVQKKSTEPIHHTNGLQQLTKVIFEVETEKLNKQFTSQIEDNSCIHFQTSHKNHLTLEFDQQRQGKQHEFPALQLTILY